MAHSGSHPKGHRPASAHLFPTLPRRLQLEPVGPRAWGRVRAGGEDTGRGGGGVGWGGRWGRGAPGRAQDWPAVHWASPETQMRRWAGDQRPEPTSSSQIWGHFVLFVWRKRSKGSERSGPSSRLFLTTGPPSSVPPARAPRGERALTSPGPPGPQARPGAAAPSSSLRVPAAALLAPWTPRLVSRATSSKQSPPPALRAPEELRGPEPPARGPSGSHPPCRAPPKPGCSLQGAGGCGSEEESAPPEAAPGSSSRSLPACSLGPEVGDRGRSQAAPSLGQAPALLAPRACEAPRAHLSQVPRSHSFPAFLRVPSSSVGGLPFLYRRRKWRSSDTKLRAQGPWDSWAYPGHHSSQLLKV